MSRQIDTTNDFGVEIDSEVYDKDFDEVGFEPEEIESNYKGIYEEE